MADIQVVKHVLIGTDTAVGSPTNMQTVPAGAIAVYDSNNTLITGGVSINDTDRLVVVQGTGSTDVNGIQMATIIGKNVVGWTGIAYTAAVKQIWYVGYNDVTTSGSIEVNNNRTYTISVNNKTNTDFVNTIDRYYYQTGLSGATQKIIAEGLASEVVKSNNTSSKTQLTVSLVGDGSGGSSTVTTAAGYVINTSNYTGATNIGVKLTDAINNDVFIVSLTEDNQLYNVAGLDTTTVSSVAMGYSNGSGADVYALEQANLGSRGVVNRVWFPITPETFAVKTTNYNIYVISYTNTENLSITSGSASQQELIIAVPTNASTWDKIQFETIMNSWMQSLGKGFVPVTL